MNLELHPEEVEFAGDDWTNALSFHLAEGFEKGDPGWFTISIGYFTEDDPDCPELDYPQFEWNDEGSSEACWPSKVQFSNDKIVIHFGEDKFIKKYDTVEIHLKDGVTKQIVDFFANHLFMGEYLSYDDDFNKDNIVPQTETRESLADEEEDGE